MLLFGAFLLFPCGGFPEVWKFWVYAYTHYLPAESAALSKTPTLFMFRRSSIIPPPARLDILHPTICTFRLVREF